MGPAAVGVAPGAAEVRGRPEPLYRREPALHEVDFDWRRLRVDRLPQPRRQHAELHPPGEGPATTSWSSACNFTPVPRQGYRLGVPEECWYEEIFNSDSTYYAGSNLGNCPGVMAEPQRKPRPAGLDRADVCRRWRWSSSSRGDNKQGSSDED